MSGAGERADLGGVMRGFLDGLPPALAEVVRAAAVPHAFDAEVLEAVLDVDTAEAERACGALREMPFVQALGDGKYALHEMVRELLLEELWRERREEYRVWSRRAAETFERGEDESSRLEAVYHWLVADPEHSADLVWDWGVGWYNAFQHEWVEALVQLGLEHDAAGRLGGRARGWILFWKGQTHFRYSEGQEALASLEAGLEAGRGDRQLETNCIQALGDVHWLLDEYEAARDRYQEALPICRAIGDRLGEANCITSLGDVHLQSAEYEAARDRYEEALPIYRAIGAPLGEANCIYRLGDVHLGLAEHAAARKRYEEALRIYRAIGHRLGEANCIKSLGNVHLQLAEYEAARERYEEALRIYRAIGHRLGEANCIWSLGDVHLRSAEYKAARDRYEEALPIYRAIGDRQGEANCIWSLGDVHLQLAEVEAARERYEKALRILESFLPAGHPDIEAVRDKLGEV